MATRRPIDDNHFRQFASNLECAIARYGEVPEGDLIKLQRQQIEQLVALEKEFRRTLIKHPWGPAVYRQFVHHICHERRNILAARPFFRERQNIFTHQISKALKKRHDKGLYRFHFNYEFILFVLQAKNWHTNRIGGKIVSLAKQIRDLRWALVEMNMPLAISRARIFWSRTPASQLSYMDLVQITALGLMSGIDKFVLPYSSSFRAMLIGRMIGNLIEQYSETLVHFYPVDKRKIYRANKIIGRFGDNPDFEKVAEEVNKDVEPGHRTNASEIADLMAASSTVSSDAPMKGPGDGDELVETMPLDTFQADESTHPDVRVETAEAMNLMARGIVELPLIEQKLLRMKGVSL
jgi:DNA-directed RNA polymerase specialized sigma subunit